MNQPRWTAGRITKYIAGLTLAVTVAGTGTAIAYSTSGDPLPDIQSAQSQVSSAQSALAQAKTALDGAQAALASAAQKASPSSTTSPAPAPSPTSTSSTSSGDVPSTLPSGNWTKAFGDEFDGTALDTSKWDTVYPWGSPLNTGTTETQCYVPGALSEATGMLTITATRKSTTCSGGGKTYTEPYASGMIQSHKSVNFTYGYAEIRAKLPGQATTWPAFWQLPADLSWPPEFDTFEGWGQPDANGHLTRITQTYITKTSSGSVSNAQTQVTGQDFTSTWHTYGVDWEPGTVTFYLDGVAKASYTTNVPAKPMYLLANLAMQNGSATNGPSTAQMNIDYIRVFTKA